MAGNKRGQGESSRGKRVKRAANRIREPRPPTPPPSPPHVEVPVLAPVPIIPVDSLRTGLFHEGIQRFSNQDALDEYNKNFRLRPALFEQHTLKEKVSPTIWKNLVDRKWGSLIKENTDPVNLTLVREILANARVRQDAAESFFVRGKTFTFSRNSVAEFLKTPDVSSLDQYRGKISSQACLHKPPLSTFEFLKKTVCPNSTLTGNAVSTIDWDSSKRFWVKFIASRLKPSSNETKVDEGTLELVYAFENNLSIDPACVIVGKFNSFLKSLKANMIFPKLITGMALKQGITTRHDDILFVPKIKSLEENSKLGRHKKMSQGHQSELPPPPRKPTLESISEQLLCVLARQEQQRQWAENNRKFHLTREPLYQYLAEKASIPTENFFHLPSQPYEFDSFMQSSIPLSSHGVGGHIVGAGTSHGIDEGGSSGGGGDMGELVAGTSRTRLDQNQMLQERFGDNVEDAINFDSREDVDTEMRDEQADN